MLKMCNMLFGDRGINFAYIRRANEQATRTPKRKSPASMATRALAATPKYVLRGGFSLGGRARAAETWRNRIKQ